MSINITLRVCIEGRYAMFQLDFISTFARLAQSRLFMHTEKRDKRATKSRARPDWTPTKTDFEEVYTFAYFRLFASFKAMKSNEACTKIWSYRLDKVKWSSNVSSAGLRQSSFINSGL